MTMRKVKVFTLFVRDINMSDNKVKSSNNLIRAQKSWKKTKLVKLPAASWRALQLHRPQSSRSAQIDPTIVEIVTIVNEFAPNSLAARKYTKAVIKIAFAFNAAKNIPVTFISLIRQERGTMKLPKTIFYCR